MVSMIFSFDFQAIQSVGEYINRGEQYLKTGNFILFTNGDYGYCEDGIDCQVTC